MAHIEDRWHKKVKGRRLRTDRYGKGKQWRARYIDPDGAERCESFERKHDAEVFLVGIEHKKLSGEYVAPAAGQRTFENYAAEWMESQVWRDTTASQVHSNMKNHVYPHLGRRPLGAVRPTEIQSWVKARSATLAPGTVEVIYRYVSAVFKAAVRDRLISSSPCIDIKLPAKPRRQVEPITVEQVRALIEESPDRHRAMVVLAAGTGMRQGEVLGLTLDRIDFLRRRVTVDQQLVLEGGLRLAPPKTEASYRIIPLPQVVVEQLSRHVGLYPPNDDGFVFTTEAGLPWRRNRYNERIWKPARNRAGLDNKVTFHALRHHYASLLIRHGESVKVVQARLGHASASETLDTYAHLWPDSEDRTREAVDLAYSDVDIRRTSTDETDQGRTA